MIRILNIRIMICYMLFYFISGLWDCGEPLSILGPTPLLRRTYNVWDNRNDCTRLLDQGSGYPTRGSDGLMMLSQPLL